MGSKYFDKREFYVKKIYFRSEGIVYKGSGVLLWNPETGFRLISQVHGETVLKSREFKSIEILKPLRVRLEISSSLQRNLTAITPFLTIHSHDLHFSQPFTLNFGRIAFFSDGFQRNNTHSSDAWIGSALYETNRASIFPDRINEKVKVGERFIRDGFSKTGFDYSSASGEHVFGEVKEKQYMYFDWSLPKNKWDKNRSWHFAEALQDAFSIITGEITRMRFHKAYRNNRVVSEYNSSEKTASLGILALFNFDILPKDLIVHLAFYLSKKDENEQLIRNIFRQIIDASNQKSEGGKALLLSTIFEAALRTLYKLPFVPGRPSHKDPFKAEAILKQFQSDYLAGMYADEWEKIIPKVLSSYKRLRHKHAHPDWISSEGGMLSNKKFEKSINDMIFLSHFYGYMILALSGLENLEPKFPKPFSEWGPIMTMTTNK